MRRDLRAVLETFVATHRGVRLGQLFGVPAAFAGRRVFAKLDRNALHLRLDSTNLPSGQRSVAGPSASGASGPSGRRPVRSGWITISSESPAAARLEMLLEQSARYVALA